MFIVMASLKPAMIIDNIDIADLISNSKQFIRVLNALVTIEPGQKLRIVEIEGLKVVEIDDSYFQSVFRWVYGHGRTQTHEYLNKILGDYFSFLAMLEDIYKNDKKDKNSNDENREKVLEIIDTHNDFGKKVINGLKTLHDTYEPCKFDKFNEMYDKYNKLVSL